MIRPYDAWILRRLLTGHELNGELTGVSEAIRPLATHLAGLSPDGRPGAWEAALSGRDDTGRIVEALADADPDGPAPDPEAGEPDDDWEPLRFGELPPVDPFPIDVLPGPAARLVVEGAEAIGCPPDFLAVLVLTVAAGVIGRSIVLLLKAGYFAVASLFTVRIGPPSDGKTPALKIVSAALRRIDDKLAEEYAEALRRWEEEAAKPSPDGKKAKPKPPPLTKPRRIDVDDITMEALPIILAENPRGLIMTRDELSAFLSGMNQFKGGKGNDRSIALKILSGDAIKKDRVGHEDNVPIRCPHPCLSIDGGMTPDMLGLLLDPKGRSDGFIERFLPCYPDPRPVAPWTENGVSEEFMEDWCDLVARLWLRSMNVKDGKQVPHVARFTPEGKARWRAHYNAHSAEMSSEEFPPGLRGAWGKLREYAGRLALVLACLDHAADPTANPVAVPEVGPRAVDNAWKLIGYFKGHARRVRAAIGLGPGIGGGPVVKAVVDRLRASNSGCSPSATSSRPGGGSTRWSWPRRWRS